MKIRYSILLLFINSCSSDFFNYGEIINLVNRIEEHGVVESAYIYEGGQESKQWERYDHLMSIASPEMLVELTDHQSPVVRCYAFHGLASLKHDSVYAILVRHLLDTTKVEHLDGCIRYTGKVCNYFFREACLKDSSKAVLTKMQTQAIDSIINNDSRIHIVKDLRFEMLGL